MEAVINKLGGMDGVAKLLSGSLTITERKERAPILRVDRSNRFGLAFLRGFEYHSQDDLSVGLLEIDFSQVVFKHGLKGRENSISPAEQLKRFKEQGYVRLDHEVMHSLHVDYQDNKEGSVLEFLRTEYALTKIHFYGSLFYLGTIGAHCFSLEWTDGVWKREWHPVNGVKWANQSDVVALIPKGLIPDHRK